MLRMDRYLLSLIGEKFFRLWLTRRYKSDLRTFLKSGQKIRFNAVTSPDVSVIVPVFNSAHHTLRCLSSLVAEHRLSLEVIIFDNASNDATAELLARCENIVVIKSVENLGFVKAVNAALKHANGRFVLLMNNDAIILEGSIGDATNVFDAEQNVGAVGARIKLATGRVQEAGSIIFTDGTTDGYLRNKRSDHSSGMYMRDVDFCSGVFLLLERRRFVGLGGLDEAFSPAYYEETDLCMRIRAQGLRVIYNPCILIEHFEFGSQPTAAAFAAISKRRPIFLQRWQEKLSSEGYCKAGTLNDVASRRLVSHPRLLLILDQCSPEDVPDSIQAAIQLAVRKNWQVSLFIVGLRRVSWPQFFALYGNKVELVLNRGAGQLFKFARQRRCYFDLVAVIGVGASDALGRLQTKVPESLAGAVTISGTDVRQFEQALDNPPIKNLP
jgi:O-antigen biosynthesis protein